MKHDSLIGDSALPLQLVDTYHRRLNYLRISVTDRCNLKCLYCTPREDLPRLSHSDILSYEEILRLVRVGILLGISKVRITGGEPFVRKGISEFLCELASLEGLSDVSLTTNGILLKGYLGKLKTAGIRRLNISLDTLNREKFQSVTGYDGFHLVWDSIMAAHSLGFHPIKINAVALGGINDDELADLAKLTLTYPFHVRFIEYMPIGANFLSSSILAPEIMNRIRQIGELIPVERSANDGPAERYFIRGAKGEIGFIRPLSHHFCNTCNRLRLTASGQLRPCLLSDHQIDVKRSLREGVSDRELADVFLTAAEFKPREHRLGETNVRSRMVTIGG